MCGACKNSSQFSLHEFAENWGNYLFRQLALEPTSYHLLSNGSTAVKSKTLGCRLAKPWEKQRVAFLRGAGAETFDNPVASRVLKHFMTRIRSGQHFDFVAILERMPDSARILDALYPLPVVDPHKVPVVSSSSTAPRLRPKPPASTWEEAFRRFRVTHGSNKWKKEENDDIAQTRRDSNLVAPFLRFDAELYSAAVERFNELFAQLPPGLPPPPPPPPRRLPAARKKPARDAFHPSWGNRLEM